MTELVNISSPAFINRIGMGSKKIIHRMLFIRHGETLANNNMMNNVFDPNKKFLNTPLSTVGHKQATNIADYLTEICFKPDRIIVSRLSRATDTSKPFVDRNIVPVFYDEKIAEYNHTCDENLYDNIGSWLYKKETSTEFVERINQSFCAIKSFGEINNPKQTIVFTHSQVISCILSCSIFGNKTETNSFFHLANGSITCIDLDEDGKFHIQCVNYTRHLDNPTGQHSPFV